MLVEIALLSQDCSTDLLKSSKVLTKSFKDWRVTALFKRLDIPSLSSAE